ncbi:MAG: hypothetical protein JXC33_10425 [Deltaproteobacteria bacterium]|nr:hypothetical protein [Deltaproteobacteria bacterium]
MENKNTTQASEARLNCCQGNSAPSYVVDGWKRYICFPDQARNGFLSLLAPAMMEPADPENRQRIATFCTGHGLAEEDVIAALRSCDFLLRQASILDLDTDTFQQDLADLSGGDPKAAGPVLANYSVAKADLRLQIVRETLADHGKVLVGLDWRVDNITASDRGARLNSDVVFLTLRYRDGKRVERITLQLTPEAVKELKHFCEKFTG